MKKALVLLVVGLLTIGSFAVSATVFTSETENTIETGGIRVAKFEDKNMNEWHDNEMGEEYLEGWTIELWKPNGLGGWQKIDEGVTDENGEVYFRDLKEGDYRVKEVLKDDWMSTTGDEETVTVISDQYVCHKFGNVKTGDIDVFKFHDDNQNGEWDDGEDAVENWTVELYKNDELYKSGTTNENGKVSFQVPIGEYTVEEEERDDWESTTETSYEVEVEHGGDYRVDFGNIHYGDIEVCKFYDENMNGEYDDEQLLEDWEIKLMDETGQETLRRGYTKDGMPCMTFEDVEPGTYTIKETMKEGWFNTTPSQVQITVEPGEEEEIWFGNAEYGNITIVKYNDKNQNGVYDEETDSLMSDVQFTGTGGLSGETDDGILNFDELMPGTYTIEEKLPEGWDNTTPMEKTVEVGPGEDVTLRFGNTELGNIQVCKFYDRDMDGEMDDGEEMLSGWEYEVSTYVNETGGERKPLDVVMMLDTSGSMDGQRLADAKAAAISFMNKLNEDDRLALYTFDGSEDSYLRKDYTYMTSSNKTSMESLINSLSANGGTPIWDSIGDSITYSQNPANQRGGDVAEIVVALTDGTDYYFDPEAGSEEYAAGSEPGTSASTHTWGHPDGLKWGDSAKHFENQGPNVGDDVYTYDYGWVDLPDDGEDRTGLIHAPIPVYTVGLGISPHEEDPENPTIGNDYNFTNEYKLWQISKTSDGEYFYAPESGELEKIFDDVFGEATGGKQVIATNVTGENGCTMFWDLTSGEYTVEENLKEGWFSTGSTVKDVEVEAGETTRIYFGNAEYSNITVYKYKDEDGDEEYDDGEMMLEDWEFSLWKSDEGGAKLEEVKTGMTNHEGHLKFDELKPGWYLIEEELNEDWCPSGSTTRLIYLEPGMNEEFWFGNIKRGDIYGRKYKDLNRNGEFDVGVDEPLDDWEIKLKANNEVLYSTTTDENGMYEFEDICPGEYTVMEEMKDGWYNVTPSEVEVNLESNGSVEVNFGNCPYQQIFGIKYYDMNMNGEYDEEVDKVIPDWEIKLYDETGNQLLERTFTTDSGYYWFENLKAGSYVVKEAERDGWFNTTPAEVSVDISCCSPCGPINFGNAEYGNITILKYHDLDADGVMDDGEPMVEDIQFTDGDGLSGVTNENGKLTFNNVMPGTYTISENIPDDWTNTTPSERTVDLEPGESVTLEFGNVKYGDIEVCKYYDENMNGEYDDGEEMLQNWTFNLWDMGEKSVIDEGMTDCNGCLKFENVTPGNYMVEEMLNDCWTNTTPIEQEVEVVAGETTKVMFGNVENGDLEGYKFVDRDQDKEWDDDEEALEDWTINVYTYQQTQMGELVASTETDENGYYNFDCLKPGTYLVREELPEEWHNSTPRSVVIDIGPGEEVEVDFGNYRYGDITGMKFCDVDRDGEFDTGMDTPLSDWTIKLYEAGTDDVVETVKTDNYGQYEFEDVAPGKYVVKEEMKSGWFNVTPSEVNVVMGSVAEREVDFGNWKYSNITVFKYYDENRNGEFDMNNDWALEGYHVTLWSLNENGEKEEMVAEGTTGEHGYYIFNHLKPGKYMVEEEVQDGWDNSTPSQRIITLGCCCEEVEFGNFQIPYVEVSNQDTTDDEVVVDEAFSNGPGWIVIHNNSGGSPGEVVGYASLNHGVNKDIVVSIDEDHTSELWAMVHHDDGTIGTYEFPSNDGPVFYDGNIVMEKFSCTGLT